MSSLSVRYDTRFSLQFRGRENAAGLTTFRPTPGDPPACRSKLPLSGMQQLVGAALPKVVVEDANASHSKGQTDIKPATSITILHRCEFLTFVWHRACV